ncbi:hypothetical protein OH77DRAFT_1517248 [Trametes cingulata]|nr:hypothetical protein OH77DRAFT_1517248 [Trametes cingulata]
MTRNQQLESRHSFPLYARAARGSTCEPGPFLREKRPLCNGAGMRTLGSASRDGWPLRASNEAKEVYLDAPGAIWDPDVEDESTVASTRVQDHRTTRIADPTPVPHELTYTWSVVVHGGRAQNGVDLADRIRACGQAQPGARSCDRPLSLYGTSPTDVRCQEDLPDEEPATAGEDVMSEPSEVVDHLRSAGT